mgnify:CR=1 FL=1
MTITEIDQKLAALPERELFIDEAGRFRVGESVESIRAGLLQGIFNDLRAAHGYNGQMHDCGECATAVLRRVDQLIEAVRAEERRLSAEREAG